MAKAEFDGVYVTESEDSVLVYDRNMGNVHFLRDKSCLDEVFARIKEMPERKSVYARNGDYTFKMNLSTTCNLDCDYCFRDKSANIRTDVSKAKQIIDYVVRNYSDKVVDFSFSVNLTSEALLEFKKIREIKAYLDEKTNPLFCIGDFGSLDEALHFLRCFPIELVGRLELYSKLEDVVNAMNRCIARKDMVCFFPLPEGMNLPQWEAEQYRNVKKLDGRNLWLFNRRFLEVLFPETFKRKPSYSFFICTNGTFYSDEIVQFFKEINLDTIYVSFDGPARVHDKHRFFYDYSASHALILENIKKFMRAGLKVSVASVLTADFPYPLQLSEYFSTLDVAGVSMVCVRAGKNGSFDLESVEELIGGYKMLYDRFFEDIRKGDYSLIDLLRDDYCFTGIKLLLGKGRLSRRCGWNEDTIFDSKGDVYPCDYFVGRKEFLRGGIGSEKIVDVCAEKLDVDNREKCKDCWCKYLCGGTCYYNSMTANGDIGVPDPVECRLNMGVRELCLKFVQRLLENGVDLYKFGKRIGIYYDDRVSFEKRFFVRKGARFLVEGTLSKVEIEIKRMMSVLLDAGARCKDEIYITIKGMKNVGRGTGAVDGAGAGHRTAAGVNKVLCAEVVVPFDGNVEFGGEIGTGVVHNCTRGVECAGGARGTGGDEREQGRGTCFRSDMREQGRMVEPDLELLREFDFGECVSGECNSKEQTVEWMKGLLGNAARNFGMMIDGSFWFKARPEAFFGYKEGLVKVFLIKQKNIF